MRQLQIDRYVLPPISSGENGRNNAKYLPNFSIRRYVPM